jgi:cadmium resistance protein CadD (predicted permease)
MMQFLSVPQFGAAMTTAAMAFAATNLDDSLVLVLWFAQVDRRLRPKHIWMGQYLGFMVLVLASLPGFLGGYFMPRPWLRLLGILPIAIGVSALFKSDDLAVQQVNLEPLEHSPPFFLAPQTYQVAAVTIANGGDNISIYVPLFANCTLAELGSCVGRNNFR